VQRRLPVLLGRFSNCEWFVRHEPSKTRPRKRPNIVIWQVLFGGERRRACLAPSFLFPVVSIPTLVSFIYRVALEVVQILPSYHHFICPFFCLALCFFVELLHSSGLTTLFNDCYETGPLNFGANIPALATATDIRNDPGVTS
jgi:hypothetical protein